jgi:hypothetical protein
VSSFHIFACGKLAFILAFKKSVVRLLMRIICRADDRRRETFKAIQVLDGCGRVSINVHLSVLIIAVTSLELALFRWPYVAFPLYAHFGEGAVKHHEIVVFVQIKSSDSNPSRIGGFAWVRAAFKVEYSAWDRDPAVATFRVMKLTPTPQKSLAA